MNKDLTIFQKSVSQSVKHDKSPTLFGVGLSALLYHFILLDYYLFSIASFWNSFPVPINTDLRRLLKQLGPRLGPS